MEKDNDIFADIGNKPPLTEQDAKNRHKLLIKDSNTDIVKYNLSLNLISKKECIETRYNFKGVLEVSFNFYGDTSKDGAKEYNTETNAFFNLVGYPKSILVNGVLDEVIFKDQKLFISNKNLKKNNETNVVRIYYYGLYSNQGVGLHHYIDPQDNREYIYSQFEPFDCNRLFPCFDQPNVKAQLTVRVIAPEHWEVFCNERENNTVLLNLEKEGLGVNEIKDQINKNNTNKESDIKIDDEALGFLLLTTVPQSADDKEDKRDKGKKKKILNFPETPKLSCYLFALCAGEYTIYENTVDPNYKVKMRVIYRTSLKQYAEPTEILKVTIRGIEFYEDYFKIPYPFNKYDQIYCPEYNMGAMENVGLVTYNEVYVWRSPPTQRRKNAFANTVLHELAHMWFGNLVTMDWWNDLWLNESFATFISHLAQDYYLKQHDQSYSLSWLLFNYYKGFAYRDDQAITTHPVMGECENTDVTETNFDSITYEKGSALLKQIYYYVGHENFGKAIHNYFSKYKWGNTIFENFISELEAISPNIKTLSYSWLTKAGLTFIEPRFAKNNSNGKIEKFEILQEACLENFNNLQTLIIDVNLYYKNKESVLVKKITVNPEKLTNTTDLFKDYDCPDAVLLNVHDWAYVKLVLDSQSIQYFKKNLSSVTDLLSRQMIYRSFFDMVRDAKLASIEYIELIQEFLSKETDQDIISPQLRYLTGVLVNYLPIEYNEQYSGKIFEMCLDLMEKFTKEKEMITTILQQITNLAVNKEHQEILLNWIQMTNKDKTLETISFNHKGKQISFSENLLSQEIRFSIIRKIYGSKYIEKSIKTTILEKEIEREGNSDESISNKMYCLGAEYDAESKKKLWEKAVNDPNSESLINMEEIMSGFNRMDQTELTKEYLTVEYFKVLDKISSENIQKYVTAFVDSFAPHYFTSEEIIKKMEMKSEELKKYDVTRRNLLENVDTMKRRLKSYNLCYEYVKNTGK